MSTIVDSTSAIAKTMTVCKDSIMSTIVDTSKVRLKMKVCKDSIMSTIVEYKMQDEGKL